jgi:DNA repair exonuclease SbcCD ATPase subunit
MNETKYEGLSQSLSESEEKICDKISEKCADNFLYAINDSIEKIKSNVTLMTEVVDKVQSCKDSYEEATGFVKNLSAILTATEQNVTALNPELAQLSETVGSSASALSDKISELLELSDKLIVKNNENEIAIDDTCKKIQKLVEEYSGSIEAVINGAKGIETEINGTEGKIMEYVKQFSDSSGLLSEKMESSIALLDDVKNSTEEYLKMVKKENSPLLEPFNDFKNDFLPAYGEQSRMIEELKEEQVKLKKMYMLGIIPAIIIVVLQIVNIIC